MLKIKSKISKLLFLSIALLPAINLAKISRSGHHSFTGSACPAAFFPSSISEIQKIVKDTRKKNKKVSIAGTKKSQGRQTEADGAVQIDLKNLNKVKSLNIDKKRVTVETGITWNKLQNYINKYCLSVRAMQSYSDFSVGGSLSVNAHGQDVQNSSLTKTVESLKIVLADGSLINASKAKNRDIFFAALGGYGLIGIIVEVTLNLTHNLLLEKRSELISTKDYYKYFKKHIKNNPRAFLHSLRLSINPTIMFQNAIAITYYNTCKLATADPLEVTSEKELKKEQFVFDLLRNHKWSHFFRLSLEKLSETKKTVSRNNAMHSSIKGLKNSNTDSTDILQEYFVPCRKINKFITCLKKIVKNNSINLLNATIRYISAENNMYLSYAPKERFAIVLFINTPNNCKAYKKAQKWTRSLIDLSLSLGGSYYLPYHLFATKKQLNKAYPKFKKFIEIKKKYDPNEIFTNCLYQKYVKI